MGRTLGAVLVMVGVGIGFSAGRVLPDSVVSAQTGWQCKSWTLQKQEDAAAVGSWLGQARTVQMSSAGLSQSGLYNVVACKQ
jgi:hypothetical protein